MNIVRLIKIKYLTDNFDGLSKPQKQFLNYFMNLKSYYMYDEENNIREEYLYIKDVANDFHFIITYQHVKNSETNTCNIRYDLNCSYKKVWYPIEQKYKMSYYDIKKMIYDTMYNYLNIKNITVEGTGMYY